MRFVPGQGGAVNKRKCSTCHYFQGARLAGSGWCHHPQRWTSSDLKIMVRGNELACRDPWLNDLWTDPHAPESGETAVRFAGDLDSASTGPVPAATPVEIAAVFNAQTTLSNASTAHDATQDVVVGDMSAVSRGEPKPGLNDGGEIRSPGLDTRAAIMKARETYRDRARALADERAAEQLRQREQDGVNLPSPVEWGGKRRDAASTLLDHVPSRAEDGDGVVGVGPQERDATPASVVGQDSEVGDRGAPSDEWWGSSDDDGRRSDSGTGLDQPHLDIGGARGTQSAQDDQSAIEAELSLLTGDKNPPHRTDQPQAGDLAGALPRFRPVFVEAERGRGARTVQNAGETTEGEPTQGPAAPKGPQTAPAFNSPAIVGHGDGETIAGREWPDDEEMTAGATNDQAEGRDDSAVDRGYVSGEQDQVLWIEQAVELAPNLDRICKTCRDFRPAEGGERGWCANEWAFTHRRMVDGSDAMPCETSLGTWWLPTDEVWLDVTDLSSHGQPTPILDAVVAHQREEGLRRRGS
jgi:hypothetical protein